ncbi:uncharacterized protein DSM5745_00952 [Aspergillus mulundensis]|uniref:Uncharacterized protein n=1 Tax=Aspergillus mulundensis TaxID=1810919 RepID=A0A3D8T512_9EURO|nr:hypothetical protein DSM5745_00952 [Aspergillus mulundensis]RDW93630.1 hypothetical protein DSM5745_00952 [Aspergillus mulundensis]
MTTVPGDPNMVHVNRRLLRLAFTYPYLMHASLAVAFSYDQYLNSPPSARRSVEECYHWSQATVLLSNCLRRPIRTTSMDKDAIWGTAAALAILTFSSTEAYSSEGSWPLKPSTTGDELHWLSMSSGKNALWDFVNPLRPDSIFNVMKGSYDIMFSPLPDTGIDGIPGPLAAICSLNKPCTAESNPYFHAAHGLSVILNIPDYEVTTGQTQLFTRCIHGQFKYLLLSRDPVALLLLYLWYRKARCIWWIELRARVERPAICEYLRLYHPEHRVHELLQ